MAIKVDPYLYNIPKAFLNHPDREVRAWFEYDNRWKNDIWLRTGGGTDEIAATAIRESYAWDTNSDTSGIDSANVRQLFQSEQAIERPFNYHIEHAPKEWRNITITGGAYTALDHDFINAKGNALIYFPEYPEVNATFTVRNGDNSRITLVGNGKMLNGCSTGIIDNQETSIDWHYFIDSDEWFSK